MYNYLRDYALKSLQAGNDFLCNLFVWYYGF